MKNNKLISFFLPAALIVILVILSYNNVVFLRRSLNPVLLIPPADIQLSTGWADITGTDSNMHGWHVDLANPAYLEWPVNAFVGKSLKAGFIPLVMPHQSLGVPLIGQYCHRILSPYQMIENLFFPHGYDLFLILRLILAGVFTYLFIRPLCRRVESSLLAAVGYGLGSIMVIYSNHEEVSNVAMMLPLLMWAGRAFFDRPGLSRGCWLTLALVLVHTAGQPEIQLYLLFLAFLYGLTRIFTIPAGSRKAALAYCAGAILLSAVIAAPQIFLFLKFHQEAWTYHPPGGNLGIQTPMKIYNFLFTFFPKLRQTPWPWSYRTGNLLWDWVGGYFSLGLLVLAAAAARGPRRNRREIILFGAYFLFILAKNLGWSPAQILGLLPFFDQTWSPRWAAPTWSFALAVLAGFGLDNLLSPSPAGEISSVPQPSRTRRKLTDILANPLLSFALLIVTFILAIITWRLGRSYWDAGQLRGYVFFSGALFFLLAGGAFFVYRLFSRAVRVYLNGLGQTIKHALVHEQIGMIAFLSAIAFAAERWFPLEHYIFSQAEPLSSYLFAAPVLLSALFGLFFMAAYPAHLGTVILSSIAIPSVILGGWADLPGGIFQTLYWVLFGLAVLSFLTFANRPRIRRICLPLLSLPLLCGLVALALTTTFFRRGDQMLRLHYYFAILILAVFSGLSRWRSRGVVGSGWFFLFLVWTELTIYIPKNHSDRYLLIDSIPFLIAALTLLGFAFWFRRSQLSTKRQIIYLLTSFLLCAGSLLVIESSSSKYLPKSYAPDEPLPFILYLQDKQPSAVIGIGRVLSPNFASAHGITDLRGCVSMNTNAYQFFLENILQVVPRGTSFSLWFTGDNPIRKDRGTAYGSSRNEHLQAFKRALPFYSLASTRYVICPTGVLNAIGNSKNMGIRKVYEREVDIWEIPALPPAFIAHKADVISMLSETNRWGNTVVTNEEVLKGERVILEEAPDSFLPESEPSAADRAELITGDNPNLLRVRFYTEQPGYLVINRAYTNLLQAYINNKNLPILKANGPFMAIPVPGSSDERVMELTYISPATRLSFILSILGLLVVGGGLVIPALKKKLRVG
ncbi:MAG: hypothetical protein P9M10_10905 [Candidatus Euphemobacter frigidus]|nr:hypothetical protein [Candidatus Euphemobacter frigidus]